MSKFYSRTIYAVSALLLFAMLGGPQLAQAWTMPQQQAQQAQPSASATTNVPPAQAYPDAPSTQTQSVDAQQTAQAPANDQQNTDTKKKDQNPLGAAAAGAGVTAGGPASRPAGMALAPAKQNRKRSLLIKLGLVAAGAAAIGAVYGLSHATGSTPPGATH